MAFSKRHLSPIEPAYIIDYNNIELLHSFLTDQGKILPRRSTHLTIKQQIKASKAIKRARMLKLLAYTVKQEE